MKTHRNLNVKLELKMHSFQIFHPKQDIPYPNSGMAYFCNNLEIPIEILNRFPPDARFFIDGEFVGSLVKVFE